MTRCTWRVRAKCDCGYIWTTGLNQSVICKCGISRIENGAVIIGNEVIDENDFKSAVAADFNKDISDIVIEQEV